MVFFKVLKFQCRKIIYTNCGICFNDFFLKNSKNSNIEKLFVPILEFATMVFFLSPKIPNVEKLFTPIVEFAMMIF
jgi:hypothetical protein